MPHLPGNVSVRFSIQDGIDLWFQGGLPGNRPASPLKNHNLENIGLEILRLWGAAAKSTLRCPATDVGRCHVLEFVISQQHATRSFINPNALGIVSHDAIFNDCIMNGVL
jgi:hypothetical protein